MVRFFSVLFIALFSLTATAGETRKPTSCHFFDALSGGADHDSAALDMQPYKYGSFHVSWTGLGGSIDSVVKVQVSNNPSCSTCWIDKSGGTFNVSGAAGTGIVVITGGSMSEAYYRVNWAHGGATGGTVNGYCMAKE